MNVRCVLGSRWGGGSAKGAGAEASFAFLVSCFFLPRAREWRASCGNKAFQILLPIFLPSRSLSDKWDSTRPASRALVPSSRPGSGIASRLESEARKREPVAIIPVTVSIIGNLICNYAGEDERAQGLARKNLGANILRRPVLRANIFFAPPLFTAFQFHWDDGFKLFQLS